MNAIFEPSLALVDIVEVLEKWNLSYFVVGSFASGFRGEFRSTNDVDIVVEIPPDKLQGFVKDCKIKFYADEASIPTLHQEGKTFNIIHEKTFVKIDFFIKLSELEVEQFALASLLTVPTTEIRAKISTTEYNIIAKLNWYLKSNRVLDRQIQDVKSLITLNRETLDLEYLRKWSAYFQTSQLLESLLEN